MEKRCGHSGLNLTVNINYVYIYIYIDIKKVRSKIIFPNNKINPNVDFIINTQLLIVCQICESFIKVYT